MPFLQVLKDTRILTGCFQRPLMKCSEKKIEIVGYAMCLFHVEAFLIISDTYLKKTNKLSVC